MSDWFLSEMIQLEDVPSMKLFYLVLEHGFNSQKNHGGKNAVAVENGSFAVLK